MLERFEFTIQLSNLWQIHGWVHQTLRTVTSAPFNEFVVWILNTAQLWSLRRPMSVDGWKPVDALLIVLAERNPRFRAVFKGISTRSAMVSGAKTTRFVGLSRITITCHSLRQRVW